MWYNPGVRFDSGHLRVAALAAADILLLYGVWAAVTCGYYAVGLGRYNPEFYLRMWPVGPVFFAVNCLFRLYHGSLAYPAAPLSPVEELRRLVGSAVLTHLGVIGALAFAYQTTENYSRFVIAFSGLAVAVLAQPFRDIVRRLLARFEIGRVPVFLVGEGSLADRMADHLAQDAYVGFRIAGRFGQDDREQMIDEARRLGVRILVVCQDIRIFQLHVEEYVQWFTHIEYMPTAQAFPVLGARAVAFGGLGGLGMGNQGRMKMLRMEKKVFDGILALLVFAAALPVFVVVPVLIKLTSRGPVFYRQKRLGLNGGEITVLKFRSMYADADERIKAILKDDSAAAKEWKDGFKLRRDPRVTPLGRLLRRLSLDELPQLFNVLAGDMALIGPRPIVKDEVRFYGAAYSVFSSVKPGMTGLWQVSGRSDTCYARRVALDTYYVLNWNPWLDLWILLGTVSAVMFMRGAC